MKNDYPDKLIVTGIPLLDGTYGCDIVGMLVEGHPQSMTNREGHRVKVMSGVRAGELWEAMEAGDNDVMIALAAVVLTRNGKRFDEALLWDAPMGSGISFEIAEREEEAETEGPPVQEPTQETAPTSVEPGGTSTSSPPSELPANGQSPTGTPDSSPSVPVTLAS